ncbi:nucleotidyltransferase domain-containing protein [Kribbella solani]|uniref:nucleotidyltransferase domain-containing protein n=1 Tax=Kribbella solani TaxID=236067 RepID=UPI0029ADE273|nr:nucleotidyltransferase domain-containing protein [Kribbella solani]MDX2972870.1 nucleotidyltransferase domain-containing protein [Kribbella solani]MDX3006982.1 nucleotidyltransferase domain-containing protein [Kribbella solani]
MQFPEPISTVVPGLHGRILGVLARTDRPLTGRAVAGLLRTPASPSGVQKVLDDLLSNGLVHAEPAGRARLYTLNRDHVAYQAIDQLTRLRELLLERIRTAADSWVLPAKAIWLFGSTARGQGGPDSDLDLLIVRPDEVDEADPRWLEQVESLSAQASRWSGNSCEVVEYGAQELRDLIERGERLVGELRRDAVPIAGRTPRQTLTRKAG